jgi:hypothetical protein
MSRWGNIWIVYFVVALHVAWGLMVAISPHSTDSTPLHTLDVVIPTRALLAASLLTAGTLAALANHTRKIGIVTLLCLIPQQGFLIITAAGAVFAVTNGHYADGVVRPFFFILADQFAVISLPFWYTAAILDKAGALKWKE